MSYEICKKIRFDAGGRLLITADSNNVYPKMYHEYEILEEYSGNDKFTMLFYLLMEGSLMPLKTDKVTRTFRYASESVRNKISEDCKSDYEMWKNVNSLACDGMDYPSAVRQSYGEYYELFVMLCATQMQMI